MAGGYESRAEGAEFFTREFREIWAAIRAVSGANKLTSAVIDKGDLTVQGGGSIGLADGGDITVGDGGSIEALGGYIRATDADGVGAVQMDGASYYLLPDVSESSRVGSLRVDKGVDSGNNLRMLPPQAPGTVGLPTSLTLRGPGGGLSGWAWVYSDGGITLDADDTVFIASEAGQVTVRAHESLFLTSTDGNVNISADAQLDAFADRIQLVSQGNGIGVYGLPTTSDAANIRLATVGGNFTLALVSSSRRYKTDEAEAVIDPAEVLSLSGKTWVDKHELDNGPEGDVKRNVGFIAEELDERPSLRQFVDYDDEGRPDAIQYDRLSVALLEVAKDQQSQIDALSDRLDALEGK